MDVKYAVGLPTVGEFGDVHTLLDLAVTAERHGWDGVFTWEAVWGVDAWVTLGAAAMVTERIRLGTLLTPASRWRPWDLASAVDLAVARNNFEHAIAVLTGRPPAALTLARGVISNPPPPIPLALPSARARAANFGYLPAFLAFSDPRASCSVVFRRCSGSLQDPSGAPRLTSARR